MGWQDMGEIPGLAILYCEKDLRTVAGHKLNASQQQCNASAKKKKKSQYDFQLQY